MKPIFAASMNVLKNVEKLGVQVVRDTMLQAS
jgi:hypothetical protein